MSQHLAKFNAPHNEVVAADAERRFEEWSTLWLLVGALIMAGCATAKVGTPRPGAGLSEYHELVTELRHALAVSRQSVETMANAPDKKFKDAYRGFARKLERLEITSIEARARADAMEKRGEAYFEEWTEEISGVASEPTGRPATETFSELREQFVNILDESRQVRQEFRKSLEGLRSLRGTLATGATGGTRAALANARPSSAQVIQDSLGAEQAMDRLLAKVELAQAAVQRAVTASAKPGGKS